MRTVISKVTIVMALGWIATTAGQEPGVPRAVSSDHRNSTENTSDGFFQFSVCRGRLFNCLATAVRSARV